MVRTSKYTQNMANGTAELSYDLHEVLGLSKGASETEIRRTYKTLITREHPDKGGNPERFKQIKLAYDTLSNKVKRDHYERTGKVARSAGEEFMDKFRGGSFGEYATRSEDKENLAEALTVRKKREYSHTAGFEAWMRSRGENGTTVFTAESMADQFGVNKGSYESVPLPPTTVHKAVCQELGPLKAAAKPVSGTLPAGLEWGEVLVAMKYVPVDLADAFMSLTGSISDDNIRMPPFVLGHQGIGLITKVGPGVKAVREDDWVLPFKSQAGTWQTLAVLKASELLVVPKECMPLEYAALSHQLCLAYRLLEDFGKLKPGDCVILNAATSTVGQAIIQLCSTLQLRTVALLSRRESFEKTALWLKSLGATEVIEDTGSVKAELEKLKFFAKPKLGLDAVGGISSQRLADSLAEGGQLVIYGCLSGKAPTWHWQQWVFKGLQVRGFNFRAWMTKNSSLIPSMLTSLGQLVKAEHLRIAFTEYELATELEEAIEHAMDRGTNTKVLLKMTNASSTEDK